MAKPTELPRWGTDETNEVEPSSGFKDDGWALNALAVSSYDNWAKRITYDWLNWLNGELEETYKIIIPPPVFTYDDLAVPSADIRIRQTHLYWKNPSGAVALYAPIVIRVGDIIKSAIVYIETNDGPDAVTATISRCPRGGTSLTTVATNNISTTGELALTSINHTVLEDNAYTISISTDPDEVHVTYVEILVGRQ